MVKVFFIKNIFLSCFYGVFYCVLNVFICLYIYIYIYFSFRKNSSNLMMFFFFYLFPGKRKMS